MERTNAEVSIHDSQPREFRRIDEERGDKPNLKKGGAQGSEQTESKWKYWRHVRRLEGFRPAPVQVVGAEPARFSSKRRDHDTVVELHLIRM